MEVQLEPPAEEIKLLRHCINDLVSVLALPAMWSGGKPSQIVRTLLDMLPGMLYLDLVYVRLKELAAEAPIEMVWVAQTQSLTVGPQKIGELLHRFLGSDSQKWPSSIRKRIGDGDMTIVPFRLGLQGEIGVIVVGSQRLDFPRQTERLLLSVAANQAAIGLQEARLMSEQKRVANELDQRVAQRTSELAAANEDLKKQILERKLAEERLHEEEGELKRSEARKSAILDSALDCIVTIDQEGCITEFNPAAERTFGYHRHEVMGKHMADVIIPPSLREQHRRGFARYLAMGEARVLGRRIEMTAVRADGGEFPVELAITRIPLDGPPSFTGYLRDITENKRREKAVQESQQILHLVLATLPVGVLVTDRAGDIILANAASKCIWGDTVVSGRERWAQSKGFWHDSGELISPENWASVRALSEGKTSLNELIDIETYDGQRKTIQNSSAPIRNAEGLIVGAIIVNEDVTEQVRATEALHQTQAELSRVSRLTTVGELTASIAHEVNQPLAAVVTNANAASRWLAAMPPNLGEAREAVQRIARDGNRASDVIRQIRALLKKSEPTRKPLNLNVLIQETVALTQPELTRKQVSLQTELTLELPPVSADRVQLQQVLLNLVANAVDSLSAVADQPRVLHIRTDRAESDAVQVAVQDNGVGIEPQETERLFQPFYTTKPHGLGMGLAISRSIVEAHGGRLWATPNAGRGATFQFTLPVQEGGGP